MAKYNLVFRDMAAKQLEQLAEIHKASKTEVVRQALNMYSFIEEAQRDGGKVYVEYAKGDKVELKLP